MATASEVQEKLRQIVESQKTIEVQLQDTVKKLKEAKEKEQICSDGLSIASKEVNDYNNFPVLSLAKFVELTKKMSIVESYYNQAKALRTALENAIRNLETAKSSLQLMYSDAEKQLTYAENNVLQFPNGSRN